MAARAVAVEGEAKAKIRGRAFYESIGSPKYVVAPMVDQSEFVSSLYPPPPGAGWLMTSG